MTVRDRLLPYARYVLMIVTGSLAAALLVQIGRYERDFQSHWVDWKSASLVLSSVLFLTALFGLATRRLLASVALACGIFVLLTTISIVKFQYLRASLHALDFYYYARPTELVFLYQQFPLIFFSGLATIVVAVLVTWFLFAVDDTRIPIRASLPLLGLSVIAVAGSYAWVGQRSKVYHFNGLYHVSAAPASAPDAIGVLLRGGFLDGADRGGKIDSSPEPGTQNAKGAEAPPTIIAILHESSFPVSIYPVQCGGPTPDALYTSSNGKKYDLRVETFGGATWLTEYGLLLGISTYYFGDARSFIGYTMQNRVKDSLPLQLRNNGYQSVALYSSPKLFVNTGPFYKSIGFDKVLDLYDLHAPSEHERDKFYYGKAIEQIRAHNASGAKSPLFIFVWTMATHAPYNYEIFPGLKPAPASICAKSPVWAEYIRRLLIAQDDLAWLTGELKSQFPDQRFMILGYGDHQPFIAREFLEPSKDNPVVPSRNTIGYKTFFRITGVNFEPDFSKVPDRVETPYLGNVMMRAAGLPRSGFYIDRDKLMALCQGRYNDCPDQNEVLSFHERLIRSSAIINK